MADVPVFGPISFGNSSDDGVDGEMDHMWTEIVRIRRRGQM